MVPRGKNFDFSKVTINLDKQRFFLGLSVTRISVLLKQAT